MKGVHLISLDRSILRPGRGSTCCGVKPVTVRPEPVRVQGVAARLFERGKNYD